MPCFGRGVTELKEIIGHLWWSGHLASPLQAQDENVEHETIVLEDEGRKLKSTNHTVRICMRHVLVREDSVVLRGDVIGQIVVVGSDEVVGSRAAKAVGWRMGFTVAAEDEDEDGTVVLSVILANLKILSTSFGS
jgi:hypothetical protein